MKYKFVSSGQNVDDALVVNQTLLGEALKPLAPVNLRGSRNIAGDLLIEWTRRERLLLPLRDNAGTPLSEEREVYIIEIYSGSTLKRTVRHFVETAWPAVMESTGSDKFAHISTGGNTFLYTASSASSRKGRSVQQIISPITDNFVEMTLIASGGDPWVVFGVIPANLDWTTASYFDGFTAQLARSGGAATLSFYAGGTLLYSEDATAYSTTGVRVRIDVYHDRVAFTKSPMGRGAQTAAISTTAPTFPLRAWGEITVIGLSGSSTGKAQDIMMISAPRGYNYTAAQQVVDFGSVQSSVKVRVMQESAIVGRGHYIEATHL